MSAAPPRVPELAPSLGRLLVPRRRAEPWVPIDDVRERLATRVLELGGAARVAASQGEREAVIAILSRNAWVEVWEQAVRQAAERVGQGMDREIEHAARRARMPARRWRQRLVTAGERRPIAARRLEAAWLALEEAVAAERERWTPELADVAAWRPPLWPVVVLWVPLAAALVWLGLILGRFVAAPAWLAGRLGF